VHNHLSFELPGPACLQVPIRTGEFVSIPGFRSQAMKHSKVCVPRASDRRQLSLWTFVRVATLLTIGAITVVLVVMLLSGDPQLWQVSGLLSVMTIVVIWTITLTIGCLVMIPVAIWRIGRQLSRGIPQKTASQGQVWDRWMDGPEPLRP
jgi:hypothetical protein